LILSGAFDPVLKAGASAVSSAEGFAAVEVSKYSKKCSNLYTIIFIWEQEILLAIP